MKANQQFVHLMGKNTIVTFVLVCLMFLDVKLQAFSNPDSAKKCLEIEGRVFHIDKRYGGKYKVELISYGKVLSVMTQSDRQTFRFALEKDRHYAIRVSKKGHAPRLISVYTNLPADDQLQHRFSFDLELIPAENAKRLDKDALDFPVAVIAYDYEMNDFYYNEEYTAHIKKQLYTGKF